MLLLVHRRSGELLRFELGDRLVPDDTAEHLVRWYLDDPPARFEALWEQQPGETRAAVSAVMPELQDDPPRLVAAIRVLGTYGIKHDHDLVEPHLTHADPSVRVAAIGSIGRMGNGPRHGVLRPLLRDEDAAVRRAAVVGLGKFGIEDVVPELEAAADEDPALAPDVATAKARIAAIGARDIPALLETVLRSREWDDLLSLMLFFKDLLPGVMVDEARSEDERAHAIWALGLWRIRQVSGPLQKLLADETQPTRLRLEALQAIGRARLGSAVDDLIARMGDPADALAFRRQSAIALGRIGRVRALDPMVAQWEDAPPELRDALRQGLRMLARPPDAALVEVLRTGGGLDVEQIVCIEDDLALRREHDPARVRARLQDPEANVEARREAILLAGLLGSRDDAAALARVAQHDPEPSLRELAARAGRRFGKGSSAGID